jgi:hypothetical protein
MTEPGAVPPATATGIRLLAWAIAGAVAGVEAVGVRTATGFVYWVASSGCHEDPTARNRTGGLLGLLVLVVLAAGPWLVAARIRRQWPLALLGALAASPALYGLARGLPLESWRGDFCF